MIIPQFKSSLKCFNLILLLHLIQETLSYEVLYNRYFYQYFDCSSLIEIAKVGGTFSSSQQCIESCQKENNEGNIYGLSPQSSDYPSGFEIEVNFNNPYQFIGVDLVYFTSEKFYMGIYDGSTLVEKIIVNKSTAENNLQELNFSFECGFNPLFSLLQTYKLTKKFTSNKLKVRFTQLPSTYGFLKIKMWSNCLENCQICKNQYNCDQCFPGFTLTQLSTGYIVCAEITPCKAAHCFSCVRSISPDFQICLKCLPGYVLNDSNVCIANTGTACNSTYIDNTCKYFSMSCQMQIPQNPNWQQCGQIPSNSQIKCPKDQNILLYDVENYQVRNCGCTQQFCATCSTTNKCDKCVTGYKLVSNQCQFDVCPSGQIQNTTTLLCQTGIDCTANCLTCTATECLTCKTGNYYIDQNNKNNCVLCSIPNCASCNTAGICIACKQSYVLNPNQTCGSCLASNCQACKSGSNLLCVTCNTNFLLQSNKQCQCQAANCANCNPNDGLQCNTCTVGYIRTVDSKCECGVSDCQTCNIADGTICDACLNPFQTFDPAKGQCACNIQHCQSCANSECDLCETGMYYDKVVKLCKCKIKDCLNCPNNICNQCQVNYTYNSDSKQCVCQVQNCLQCNAADGDVCDKCLLNFEAKQTEQCAPTATNCIQSDFVDGKKCVTCQTNYNNVNQICVPQVSKCIQGVDNDGSKCQQCIKGYAPNTNKDRCICSLANCDFCDPVDGTICVTCANNFDLVNSNSECKCKVNNCLTCNPSDGTLCDTCLTSYTLTADKKQCLIDCTLSNCAQCENPPNNNTQCQKCFKGYVVDQQSRRCVPCQAANCEFCLEYNPNQCQICKKNYEIAANNNNVCTLMDCQVIGCISCDPTDLQKCLVCGSDYTLEQSSGICQITFENDFDLSQKQNLQGYNITLIFRRNVVYQTFQKIDEIIKVNIDNFDSYDKQIIKQSEKEVLIVLTLKKDCKGQTLLITMDNQFVKVNNIAKQNDQLKLINYAVVTQDQQKQAETTKSVTENVKTTLLTTMLPIAMIGNFYVLFNTIDLTTFIYFLLYVKVRYPINITNFCGVFQNFQMAFIPNLFQVYWLDGYTQPDTPTKFLENGSDAYFLNGGGQSLTIIAGILSIYVTLKIISYVNIYPALQHYVQSKLESGWEYCGFFDLIWTVYMYILVSSFLQIFNFSFDNTYCFLNYSLWALFTLSVFFIPIWITIFISKATNLNDPLIQKQFGSIIGGLKIPEPEQQQEADQCSPNPLLEDDKNSSPVHMKGEYNEKLILSRFSSLVGNSPTNQNTHQIVGQDSPSLIPQGKKTQLTKREQLTLKWARYTNIFLYFRKILYAIFIIFLADFPYLQLFTISLLNLFLAIHYFYLRPHDSKIENIRNGLSEAMLMIMQGTICILVNDYEDEVEQDRINVGWILIACASSILLLHIMFVVIDLLRGVFNLIKDFIQILIKFKKGYLENKRSKEEQKLKLTQLEKLGGIIPNVLAVNNLRSIETKRLTGLFIQNVNNSIMSRRKSRRNTNFNELSFLANGGAAIKMLESQAQSNQVPTANCNSTNKIFKNGEINPADASIISNLQIEPKYSRQILNQDNDVFVNKQVRCFGDKN